MQIAADVAANLGSQLLPMSRLRKVTLWLEAGSGQGAVIVARLEGTSAGREGRQSRLEETVEVGQSRSGYTIARIRR